MAGGFASMQRAMIDQRERRPIAVRNSSPVHKRL